MKKLSLIAALTLSTMLSACGGGGGGGHSFLPPTIPDITNPDNPGTSTSTSNDNEVVTEMRSNLITDQDAFTQLVKGTLGEDVYAGVVPENRASRTRSLFAAKTNDKNMCKSERDCNQQIFDNMVKVLLDKKLEDATLPEIKQALLLAGFTQQDLAGHIDDIKSAQEWIRNNPDTIKDKVDNVLNNYADLNITNAKLNLVTLHEDKQNSYVRLTLDENNNIDGVEFSRNKGMANELNYQSVRDGHKNEFNTSQKIYRYGINCRYYTGTFVESFKELTKEEQKDKLYQRVDELAATGVYDSDSSNPTKQTVANIKKAIDIALGFAPEDPAFDVSIYEGDARDVGSESDKFEFFHMNYTKDEKTTYSSSAKDMKLVYSDFGILTKDSTFSKPVFEGVNKETFVFAGGYEDKKIEANNITENMEFAGRAVGAVNVVYGENGGAEITQNPTPLDLDGEARLSFDAASGNQTVTATFDNWYDVTAETSVNGGSDKLTLNNWKDNSDDYKFRDQDTYIVDDFTTAKQLASDPDAAIQAGSTDHSDPAFGALNIGYYGEKNTPSETTGYVYYEEGRGYNSEGLTKDEFIAQYGPDKIDDYYDMVKNISVNIGFGAQKQ